jgi:NTE family protein
MQVGLVLSGGGARGFVHVGALQAFKELGITIHAVSGVSAGAIVGSLFASGFEAKEILRIIHQTRLFQFLRPSLKTTGLMSIERFQDVFLRYLPHNSFEALHIPLWINATDLITGEEVFFHDGELVKPILASACIPLLFTPIELQGRLLVDGGVVNNFPIEPLAGKVDYTIGIHCNALDTSVKVDSFKKVIERSLDLSAYGNVKTKLAKVGTLIEPDGPGKFSIFEKDASKELFAQGYEATFKQSEQIKKSLDSAIISKYD